MAQVASRPNVGFRNLGQVQALSLGVKKSAQPKIRQTLQRSLSAQSGHPQRMAAASPKQTTDFDTPGGELPFSAVAKAELRSG